jgi:hypothetical protein
MQRIWLALVRYGVPAAMAIAGVVALGIGGSAAGFGVVIIGFAAIVLLINVLFRVSLLSNRERDAEEQAREHYARHGRWPDEPGPGATG